MLEFITHQIYTVNSYAFSNFATGILALFMLLIAMLFYKSIEKDKMLLYTMSLEFTMFLYTFSYGIGISVSSDQWVVFWLKIMYVSITLLMIVSLYTADYLTHISYQLSKLILSVLGLIFTCMIIFTDLIISSDVIYVFHNGLSVGPYFQSYFLYNIISVFYVVYIISHDIYYASKHKKADLKDTWSIYVGLVVFLLLMLFYGLTSVYVRIFRARLSFGILFYALMIIIFFYNRVRNNIRRKEELFNQYIHDSMTHLYTRNYFLELLKIDMKDHHYNLRIGMIDMNNFKSINDRFGHNVGDEVLKYMGILLKQMDPDVTAGRIGGDEFLIYSKHLSEKALLSEVQEVMNAFKKYVKKRKLDQNNLGVGMSFGYASYNKTMDYIDFSSACDEAMYEAKSQGNYCIKKFNDSDDQTFFK